MTPMIIAGLCSTACLRTIVEEAVTPWLFIQTDSRTDVEATAAAMDRMVRVAEETDAAMVYSDYFSQDAVCCLNDCLEGSVRDDFDFGPLVMVRADALKEIVESMPDYNHAAWYAARLSLSTVGPIVHVPEPLYSVGNVAECGGQFDYVNPRNREVQIEMEQAFTAYLRKTGAWIVPRHEEIDFTGDFPVEASVVIPVKNRVSTVGDAVRSALAQETDFDYNVIVVDNHSTDGTTELLREMASQSPRLIHIVPESMTLGIGGCWNEALGSKYCGRFAVQLDSDDLYSSTSVLSAIVDCFRCNNCAMVVGSYKLTDFNLDTIPPGVIDHREWTDDNGPNNLLRINGMGAPRAFFTGIARSLRFPNVSYGEDYAMALRITRSYPVKRIYDVLYLCRRWEGNSDASLTREKANRFNYYKDTLRSWELSARRQLNHCLDD